MIGRSFFWRAALFAAVTLPGQIDSVCFEGNCEFLTVRRGSVHYVELAQHQKQPIRDIALGNLAPQAPFPGHEAPIRVLISPGGWRVVVSAFLDHVARQPGLRVRFFAAGGRAKGTGDVMAGLDDAMLGHLFGGKSEFFAITTEWEHSYNVSTEVWWLRGAMVARQVLNVAGSIDHFMQSDSGPGVWISEETYDGQHADTKGRRLAFWQWNPDDGTVRRRQP